MSIARSFLAFFGAASAEPKIDAKAQLDAAIKADTERHQKLQTQAATIIGQQKHLELQIKRQAAKRDEADVAVRAARRLAEEARASGNDAKALENEQVAHALAANLTTLEANLEEMSRQLEPAVAASNEAKDAVAYSESALRTRISDAQRLRGQLEAAKMQERINEAVGSIGGLRAGSTVDIEKLRAQIERRHDAALTAAAGQSLDAAGSLVRSQKAALEASASSRVAALRRSMGLDQLDDRDDPVTEVSSLDLSTRRRGDLTA